MSEKDVQQEYQQLTDREHVLKRPDSYVGTLDTTMTQQYVVSLTHQEDRIKIIEKEIAYIPAFERIFLEILSNAADNMVRTVLEGHPAGRIKVSITDYYIEIYNEGLPVPTDWHQTFKQWIPTMIFFSLRAGSNFDDEKVRKWGGRNGYGAKLTAIFSNTYEVTCHNVNTKIHHFQRASKNLAEVEPPERTDITDIMDRTSYTKVKYSPDFKRFYTANVDNNHKDNALHVTSDPTHCGACWNANDGDKTTGHMSFDTVEMFAALTFDFSFNNRTPIEFEYKSEIFNIDKKMIFDARDPMNYVKSFIDKMPDTPPIYFETQDGDNRVIFIDTPMNGFQRSFANALPTREGGVHVNAWLNALCAGLKVDLEKKAGIKKAKPGAKKAPSILSKLTAVQIAPHVTIFLSHYCNNPKFTGQTKEKLSSPSPVGIQLPDKIIKEFSTWNAYTQIEKSMIAKDRAKQNKALNPRRARFLIIDGMDDAVWAATDKSDKCAGFICEGKSAKTFFTKGLAGVKDARDRFGCLPIRGKILNTAKATTAQILESKIVDSIVKFFGLQLDVDYMDPKVRKTLRYGKCIILVDADVDGIHIKMLLIQFFSSYLNLLESGFLVARLTPVLLLTKGKTRRKFYSDSEYERWKTNTPDWKTYTAKYFKGLGSATDDIISETFTAPVEQLITCDEEDRDILGLAMNADATDDRKELYRMLHSLKPSERLDSSKIAAVQQIVFEELIQFAMAANERAIPKAIDGLKKSYRQAVFTLLQSKKTGWQDMSVITGWIKAKTKYHHGESAMIETLVGLSQDYPGANNIPLLLGEGGYGSRLGGGKDHAASRYLKGKPSPILAKIFRDEDDILLKTIFEDGDAVCVETYYPIIPLQLVNRCAGVGWGWSSDTPNYHPFDIIDSIKAFIAHIKDGQTRRAFTSLLDLPWYRNYKGVIFRGKKNKIISRGYFRMEGFICYVYDLPINVSGSQFEKQLNEFQAEGKIEGFKNLTIDVNRPSYIIYGCKEPFLKHKGWLMECIISDSQCTYLNENLLPTTHVMGVNDVLIKWCAQRYGKYVERKLVYLKQLKDKAAVLELKVKFIDDVIATPPRFDIRAKDDEYISSYMAAHGYPMEFLNTTYGKFSAANVRIIKKKLEEMYAEIEWYMKTHPGDIWIAELDELKTMLDKMYPGQWTKHYGYGTSTMDMPK
jgi:DNA topoisomerase-2